LFKSFKTFKSFRRKTDASKNFEGFEIWKKSCQCLSIMIKHPIDYWRSGMKGSNISRKSLNKVHVFDSVHVEPSRNVTRSVTMNNRVLPIHPGRILLEEFLAPRGISVWHLAKDIDVSVRRIYQIIQGQRPITADIAHRLAHYFGMSERFWLKLQVRYDGTPETKFSTSTVNTRLPSKRMLTVIDGGLVGK
jgi:addiction module HigA family antidote